MIHLRFASRAEVHAACALARASGKDRLSILHALGLQPRPAPARRQRAQDRRKIRLSERIIGPRCSRCYQGPAVGRLFTPPEGHRGGYEPRAFCALCMREERAKRTRTAAPPHRRGVADLYGDAMPRGYRPLQAMVHVLDLKWNGGQQPFFLVGPNEEEAPWAPCMKASVLLDSPAARQRFLGMVRAAIDLAERTAQKHRAFWDTLCEVFVEHRGQPHGGWKKGVLVSASKDPRRHAHPMAWVKRISYDRISAEDMNERKHEACKSHPRICNRRGPHSHLPSLVEGQRLWHEVVAERPICAAPSCRRRFVPVSEEAAIDAREFEGRCPWCKQQAFMAEVKRLEALALSLAPAPAAPAGAAALSAFDV